MFYQPEESYTVNKFSGLVLALALALTPPTGKAQGGSVPGSANLSWVNPTLSVDSVPLTGPYALTAIKLYVSTSPITTLPATPTQVLSGAPSAFQYTATVTNGQTLYFRITACNGTGVSEACSAPSAEVSKQILLNTAPRAPTSVTVDFVINFQ